MLITALWIFWKSSELHTLKGCTLWQMAIISVKLVFLQRFPDSMLDRLNDCHLCSFLCDFCRQGQRASERKGWVGHLDTPCRDHPSIPSAFPFSYSAGRLTERTGGAQVERLAVTGPQHIFSSDPCQRGHCISCYKASLGLWRCSEHHAKRASFPEDEEERMFAFQMLGED